MQVLDIINIKGEKVGKLNLKPEIFAEKINQDVIWQDVRRILAGQRRGTASTKTRKEVRGGGIKPWRQKGTGRARIGSIRAPHWRGGGVVFGPHPRDYSFPLSKKVRKKAVQLALTDKLNANAVWVVDELKINHPKTKEVIEIFEKLKLKKKKILLLINKKDEILFRGVHNIKDASCKEVRNLNTYDVLSCDLLLFSKDAFEALEKRLA